MLLERDSPSDDRGRRRRRIAQPCERAKQLGKFRDVTVVRRASMSPNDVIVIPRAQLDADLVSRAVYHLQLSRKANGLKPARDEKHRVGPADRVSNNPYAEEAEMWVRLIDQSDPTNVPGFGLVRAMTVFLPNNDRAIASSR